MSNLESDMCVVLGVEYKRAIHDTLRWLESNSCNGGTFELVEKIIHQLDDTTQNSRRCLIFTILFVLLQLCMHKLQVLRDDGPIDYIGLHTQVNRLPQMTENSQMQFISFCIQYALKKKRYQVVPGLTSLFEDYFTLDRYSILEAWTSLSSNCRSYYPTIAMVAINDHLLEHHQLLTTTRQQAKKADRKKHKRARQRVRQCPHPHEEISESLQAFKPLADLPVDPPASSNGGESTCIICFEGLKTHLSVPCGHQSICITCSQTQTQCPYCRAGVDMWVQVRVV